MKYSIVLKFVAIVLCACCLLTALCAGAAVIGVAASGLYSSTIDELQEEKDYWTLNGMARTLARQYAAIELGGLTEHMAKLYSPLYTPGRLTGQWRYVIESADGRVLVSSGTKEDSEKEYAYWVDVTYPVVLKNSVVSSGGQTSGWAEPSNSEAYLSTHHMEYTDEDGVTYYAILGICEGPSYQVKLYLTPEAMETDTEWLWVLAEIAYRYRYTAIAVLLCALLLFAGTLTYLCCAAGRKPGSDTVRPGGLNRFPLDLYAAVVTFCSVGAIWLGMILVEWGIRENAMDPALVAVVTLAGVISLMVVAFLFAFAAQVKTKGGFWWRRSVVGTVLRWIGKGIGRLFGLLPLAWQWLLTAAVMGAMVLFAVAIRSGTALFFAIIACIAIVIHGASCFAKLYDGVRRMSRGDLNCKVNTAMMTGNFQRFALDLNTLAGVAVEAAKRQMTSERMKAELVTNVSHDIKTPLTSIINYVDLLKQAKTEAEQQQYLEVLTRQSQRMKKLIEDLVEMSKASSGAMSCELTRLDAAEAVNQALGEFSDKLEKVGLTPMVRYPTAPVFVMADGRLTWRVLSNLLSNAVKYAMPGTRLYVDVVSVGNNVLISVKNVSREPLNTGASELMERFVRGDASRNTEGSGLGLNIAKNLMELQHGQLQLLVDGDLFKATMILPKA